MDVEFPSVSAGLGESDAPMIGKLETLEDRKNAVLAIASRGIVLVKAAEAVGVSRSLIQEWARADPTFAAALDVARESGCESLEHEIQEAGHSMPPAQARVVSENLKWLLSKRKPETYSDRMQLDVNQTVDVAAALQAGRERVLRLGSDHAALMLPQAVDSQGDSSSRTTDSQSAEALALAEILE